MEIVERIFKKDFNKSLIKNGSVKIYLSSISDCGLIVSKLYNPVNDEYFVACLDLGHAEMRGSGTGAVNMIHTLGKHLQALHIHDNDQWHDSHQLPFTMKMDFDAIVKALRDINYQGDFTLEADQYLKAFDEKDIFDGMKEMARCARKLADMFER